VFGTEGYGAAAPATPSGADATSTAPGRSTAPSTADAILVENLIARCKQYRSLATRDDKRAASYRSLWTFAMTLLWIKAAH
jgi:hypothetical protein